MAKVTKMRIWEAQPGDVLGRRIPLGEAFMVRILTKTTDNRRHVVTYCRYDAPEDNPLSKNVYRATDDRGAPSGDEVEEWDLVRRLNPGAGTPAAE